MYTLVGFPKYGFDEESFFIGHIWLPYFSEHTGQAQCVRVQSKTPIKINTFDSGNSEEKINNRFTGESWKQFKFEPCYTCEKTSQLSYKSRVLHSIMVVHACGGISERGVSRNFHYVAYFVDKIYVIGDGYYTCVPIRISTEPVQ